MIISAGLDYECTQGRVISTSSPKVDEFCTVRSLGMVNKFETTRVSVMYKYVLYAFHAYINYEDSHSACGSRGEPRWTSQGLMRDGLNDREKDRKRGGRESERAWAASLRARAHIEHQP